MQPAGAGCLDSEGGDSLRHLPSSSRTSGSPNTEQVPALSSAMVPETGNGPPTSSGLGEVAAAFFWAGLAAYDLRHTCLRMKRGTTMRRDSSSHRLAQAHTGEVGSSAKWT